MPPDQEVDAHQRQHLVRPPAAQGVGVGEDDRQPGQRRAQLQERLEELDEEVDAVGQLAHHADAEEGPQQPQVPHAPTAE